MSEHENQLRYASPAEPAPRPPMYSLVLCVLFGAFLLALGATLMAGAVATVYARIFRGDGSAKLWAAVFVPIGAVFFLGGVVAMTEAVHGLRGIRPRNTWWERFNGRRP